jgi:uncharacterized membrane-anchored protein
MSVAKPAATESGVRSTLSKVPQVTVLFWVVKILTTGMGEAASDYLRHTFGTPAIIAAAVVLAAVLVLQLRATRYRPLVYWSVVAVVSVFGTMFADTAHRAGLPLWATSTGYLVITAVIFWVWWRTERTLAFETIATRRREGFYWAAVLATFALGTALGDLTASTWGLGFLASGVMFGVLILLPAAGRLVGLSRVLAFWVAYVLTRPLGASFADWMSMPARHGGLGLGTGPVALIWLAPILVCVGLLAVRDRAAAR